MPRAKKTASNIPNTRLFFGPSFEAAWEHVILPWFESVGLAACDSSSPVVVAVPHPARAQLLRARLLEENVPLLGVHFLSPPQLREILLDRSDIELPLREDLRLLLSIAAEQELAGSSTEEEEKVAAKSVRRAPDYLLRTIDELKAGGWKFEQAGPPSFRELVRRFEELVQASAFTSLQEADRLALKCARAGSAIFGRLLVTGFDGGHWPLWPLLQAAVTGSEQSVIILSDPRDEARDLDEAWFGTWEQAFGSADPIPAPNLKASHRAFSAADAQLDLFAEPPRRRMEFLLGRETTEEAQAIVALTCQYLADPAAKRIGILFPAPGALARSVAALLEQLKIPHYDGIGHFIAPTLEDLSWLAWLRLQESNRLFPLLNFLTTLQDNDALFAFASRETIDNILRRAFSQLLIDDLEVLGEFCAHHFDYASAPTVAGTLSEIQFLPPKATLAEFVEATLIIFETLKWKDRAAELQRLSATKARLTAMFSRQTYLRWLREILGKPKRSRDTGGAHPYSHIHLLSIAEAEGEPWSHVILVGLNEGAWPPTANESDFVRDSEIETLNTRIKILNQKAIRPGRHGEGQWSVSEGTTLCLGAAERRQIALRQIANVVEATSGALAMTASLFTESVPRRIANPSEFFTRLYFETHGKALSQTILEALREQTREWIARSQLFLTTVTAEKEIAQTRLAYDERRKDGPAGEFEFALREPPPQPISFSASETERLFKTPALIWMKSFLGVQADEQDTEQWNLAVGNWVHHWLSQIIDSKQSDTFGEIVPNPAARVESAADRFRNEIAALIKKLKRVAPPDWWTSTWSNAAYIANCFVGHVAQAEGWHFAGTEWSLRNLPPIAVGDTDGLKLRGRIDLILAPRAPESNRFEDIPLWVVDYKTGKRNSLRSSKWKSDKEVREGVRKQFLKGDGVQVALYALALHELGANEIGISLLARGTDLAAPQLSLSEVIAHEDFWRELAGMQRNGIFGMRGYIRSEFGFTGDYPLATLAVDKDLLETKWELTHPGFSTSDRNEEEA